MAASETSDRPGNGTPRPDLKPACLLAQAHPKLAEAYLDVWYVAHDPQAAELDRRIAAAWLERMTLVMEAIAAPAPVECRKAA